MAEPLRGTSRGAFEIEDNFCQSSSSNSRCRGQRNPNYARAASAGMHPVPSGMLPFRTGSRDSLFMADSPSALGGPAGTTKNRCKLRKALIKSWAMWPAVEVLVVLFCTAPACLVFGSKVVQPHRDPFRFFGSKQLTFSIVEIGLWVHFIYCLIRVLIHDHIMLNLALAFLLVVQRALLWGRYEAKGSDSYCIWNSLVFSLFTIVLVVICIRLCITLQGLVRFARHTVSQKKRRFVDSRIDVDLDLTYITSRIIAMGWPTEAVFEQQFRNPIHQVQKFFEHRHPHHYKVYNLCAERTYQSQCFENEYHRVRFLDHNICPLEQMGVLCSDMEDFLKDAAANVVAVHCKAGKGRTGMIIAALLLHLNKCKSATDALAVFGKRRTYNGKGVTIPSQIRYVNHYEAIMREHGIRPRRALQLARIEFLPEVLDVDVKIQVASPKGDVLFDSASSDSELGPVVEGDFKVNAFVGKRKIFQAWMHTSYDPQWQASYSTHEDLSFSCDAGHNMRLTQAAVVGTCSICTETLRPGDDVFECRECEEVVWRCPKCPVAGSGEEANGSRLRAIIDSSKFILRARSQNSNRSSVKVVPATPRLAAPLKSRLSTSSLAPTLVTCPSGHRLVQVLPKAKASEWEGHWVCDGCRTHSWEQHITRYSCDRCSYNLCNNCYDCPNSVGDGAGAQSATVVWQQPGDAGFPRQAWVAFLKKADLDGPHKQSKKAKKAACCRTGVLTGTPSSTVAGTKSVSGAQSSSTASHSPRSPRHPAGVAKGQSATVSKDVVNALQEVRFYFTDVIDSHSLLRIEKEHTAASTVGAYRSRKSRAGGHKRQSIMNYVMGSYWSDEGDEGDYDALADDTDNEVNLTIMCRGYLLRQLGGCCVKRRRLCELHTNGELHIDGTSLYVDSVVMNLAACEITQDATSQEWIITSDATSTTVHLEAETEEDAEKWEEAFVDIQKVLEKPPFHLPDSEGRVTVQRSFFHILVDDTVDPERMACIVAFQWNVRLLTLGDDCCLYMHSAATGYEEVFSDLSREHENSIQLIHTQLQGENYVVFQVPCPTGEDTWHTLAAEADTFEQLCAQVNALSRQDPLRPFVASLCT